MKLSEYEWSRNPRGLHSTGAMYGIDVEGRYLRQQYGWAKLLAGGTEHVEAAQRLKARGCTPLVRIWRRGMGASYPDAELFHMWQQYIDAGVKWFELHNEPNLDVEWPWPEGQNYPEVEVTYENFEGVIKPLMDNWLNWAEWMVARGAYPGMIALSESDEGRHASIYWAEAFIAYLASAHRERFRHIIGSGMWIATHPYLANHFYQEVPGKPATARAPSQHTADEGGWHFEYPLDPICQAHDPGRTVWGGTALTPKGDPVGLTNMGVVFNELLRRYVNAGPVPVVGTEGGIWRIPAPDDGPHVIDTRYPGYTWQSHAQATIAMFEWIAREAPPWMFGVTLWKEDDYYVEREDHGFPPALTMMENRPPILKQVPPIETLSPDVPPTDIPYTGGPGPVHGTPDYHFLVLAPGLQDEWFFEAAANYWQTFRPMIVTNLDLIQYIPTDRSLAVTVLARSDTIDYMNAQIRDAWPNIWYDPVIADTLEGMTQVLNWRADALSPFGIIPDEPVG